MPVWLFWTLYTAIIFFFFGGAWGLGAAPSGFASGDSGFSAEAGAFAAGFSWAAPERAFLTISSCSPVNVLIWLFTSIFFSVRNWIISLLFLFNSFASSCTLFDILTTSLFYVCCSISCFFTAFANPSSNNAREVLCSLPMAWPNSSASP